MNFLGGGGKTMLASYSWPPPFCAIFYFLVACLSSCGCSTLLSRLLKLTWGGNNLFGKYGPNLGLGVGLLLFLSWVSVLV